MRDILCVNDLMAHRFPESLKKLRRRHNRMTQAVLAERIGLSKNMVTRYELGMATPEFRHLMRLIDALDCSPNDLLGWEPGRKMRDEEDVEVLEEEAETAHV